MIFDYVDGQPLPFSEIEKDLPGHSAELLLESKWTFITQEVNNLFLYFSFSLNACVLTNFCFLIIYMNNNVLVFCYCWKYNEKYIKFCSIWSLLLFIIPLLYIIFNGFNFKSCRNTHIWIGHGTSYIHVGQPTGWNCSAITIHLWTKTLLNNIWFLGSQLSGKWLVLKLRWECSILSFQMNLRRAAHMLTREWNNGKEREKSFSSFVRCCPNIMWWRKGCVCCCQW